MAPVVSPPEALIDDRQPLLPEPAHGLVTTREIVVAGRVFLGELAPHRRQPAYAKALEGPLDMVLPQYLDRQVHQATRPDSPGQIGQHAWPVFGRDMLHRLDGQDRVEPGRIRQILQRCALKGECDAPRPGPGQHARRLVSARDPVAGRSQHRKVLARPARRIQHSPAGRDQAQNPGHPFPLHVPSSESPQVVLDWERIVFRTVYTDTATPIPVGVPVLGFVSGALHRAARPPPGRRPGQGLTSPRGSYSLGLSQDHRQDPLAAGRRGRNYVGPRAGKPVTRR